jgi:hypothetical protein
MFTPEERLLQRFRLETQAWQGMTENGPNGLFIWSPDVVPAAPQRNELLLCRFIALHPSPRLIRSACGGGSCSQEDLHVAVSDAVAGCHSISSSWIIVTVVVGLTAIFYLRVKIPDSHREA